jgi:hypothetical protein
MLWHVGLSYKARGVALMVVFGLSSRQELKWDLEVPTVPVSQRSFARETPE